MLQKLGDEESSDNADSKTYELFRRSSPNTKDGFDDSKSPEKGERYEERFNQRKNLTDADDSAISEPSQSAAEVHYDDNMARVGSSQSVDDSVLDGFINDVLTKASRPDVAIPWSPSELAAESPSTSCLHEEV